jgi:hypothetical protein
MHPLSKTNFGTHGVLVRYYNGTSLTTGYIVKQIGTTRYNVTDGTNPKTVTLAQTATQLSALGSGAPTLCTILVNSAISNVAHGATFAATYALDSTTTVNSGGFGYSVNDILAITGGVRATGTITVGTVAVGNTITVNGTVVSVVASGATGPQVNTGTPTAVALALYNYLSVSVNTQINYAVNGAVLTLISKTSGTSSNLYTLASSANFTISGAFLTGGVNDIAGTPSAATVATITGSSASTVTVSTVGAWTTLPSGPVFGYYATNGRTPVLLTARFKLASVTASGGVGYVVGDNLSFAGQVDATVPTAHISTISTGAATGVVVDTAGSGITTAATGISTVGLTEHAKVLYDSLVQTIEGNRYYWNLNASINGSAVISKYA